MDIESTLQKVQGTQRSAAKQLNGDTATAQDEFQDSNAAPEIGEGTEARASPSVRIHDAGRLGDIDTAEDSIDGMGAIKFTDEEDWGYFGR